MSASEFSCPVKLRPLPAEPLVLEASEAERTALAKRFGITAVEALDATVTLEAKGETVVAHGNLTGRIVQACAISGEDFMTEISEPVALRFVPATERNHEPNFEIELDAEELDEVEIEGDTFDLGEALAQTLGLAIDPYAEGPNADEAREKAGITGDDEQRGPLAAMLEGLKKD